MTAAASAGFASRIFVGRVAHARLRPFHHRFAYRVFTMLLDLDELPALHRSLRLFAYNRAGLFSFHDADHGPRDGTPLRPWIEARLAEAGIDLDGGPIRLLCFPRVLGYVFNPLTVWFCHDRDGRLGAILYEVSNTRGERHGYVVPIGDGGSAHRAEKAFYVSPFIGMEATYRFRLRGPDERLHMMIREDVPEGPQLVATLSAHARPLGDGALARLFFSHPILTQKVIGAIHWEALRLWLKGAKIHPHTPRGGTIRLSAGTGTERREMSV